jgi:ABC-type nitrate/sulfonate/bicarbonate transport system substrate-binding protein
LVLDVRRGDGPAGCFDYTLPVLATTDRLVENVPDAAVRAQRALVATLQALRGDPSRATQVGEKRFPPREAALIADIVRRDLPFYNAAISRRLFAAVNQFARAMGILDAAADYSDIVWRRGNEGREGEEHADRC